MEIHPTAIVHPQAILGENVKIGPYSIVEEDTQIGDRTQIHSHVVIGRNTTIGTDCQIYKGAVVGEQPQDVAFDIQQVSFCQIGNRSIIREYVTIHRGTKKETATIVGDDCFIMIGAHIAHNCIIGDHAVIANAVLLGGYVEIGERAFLGGGGVYQQFARIGKLSICSGNIAINVDIPPFMMAIGYRPWIRGLNLIGLKRAGISKESILSLKNCYRLLYKSDLTLKQGLERIEKEINTEESRHLLEFCRYPSKYSICIRTDF